MDPGLKKGNCLISSPLHSIGGYYRMKGFRSYLPYAWKAFYYGSGSGPIFYTILSMNCEQSISDHNYIPFIPCNTTGYSSSSSPTYSYAIVGEYVSVVDMPYSCTISTYMVIQPLKALPESSNLSMSDLQDYLLLGLQLSNAKWKGKFATIQLWMRIPFTATTQATCTKNVSRIHDDLLLSSLNE